MNDETENGEYEKDVTSLFLGGGWRV